MGKGKRLKVNRKETNMKNNRKFREALFEYIDYIPWVKQQWRLRLFGYFYDKYLQCTEDKMEKMKELIIRDLHTIRLIGPKRESDLTDYVEMVYRKLNNEIN